MAIHYTAGRFKYLKSDGTAASGYRLYTFDSGTTTFRATYTDATLTTANSYTTDGSGLKYITLDARGEAQVWLDTGAYTFVVATDTGVTVETTDGVQDQAQVATDTLREELAAETGASLIGLSNGTVADKLGRILTLPDDFGAPTDGTTDATTAVLAALNSGKYIDGCGLTYKITAAMAMTTGIAPKLRNCTLDFSTVTASSTVKAISCAGSQGSALSFASSTTTGATTATLTDVTGLVADQWVWVSSQDVWSTGGGTNYIGFIAQIRSINTGTKVVTFHEQLPYALTTSPTLAPLTLLSGVEFRNVTIIGQAMTGVGTPADRYDIGIYVEKAIDPILQDVHCKDINYAGVFFDRCVGARRYGGSHTRARTSGLAYATGIVGGCLDTQVIGLRGDDVRHLVTHGGLNGVNRKSLVAYCVGDQLRDAGVDAHPAIDYLSVVGCQFSVSTQCTGSGSLIGDGIICQGPNFEAVGNTIINAARHGIFAQLSCNQGGAVHLSGNLVRMSNSVASTGAAFLVTNETTGSAVVQPVYITGSARGSSVYGAYVNALGGNISDVTIDLEAGSLTCSSEAVFVRAQTGKTVSTVNVRGSYKTSGTRCVRVYADAGGTLTDASVRNVTTSGGTYGISVVSVTGANISTSNTLSTNRVALETTSTTGLRLNGKYYGSAVYDPPSLGDGAGTTTTVTVTGAQLGDMAGASFSLTTSGITITAWVSAADTVSVRFQNESGGTLDIGSGTLTAFAEPQV